MPEVIHVGGLELRFLHNKEDTGGSLDMFEMTVQPNARMPVPHYHETWDETIYGLSGVTTWCGAWSNSLHQTRGRPWFPQRHTRTCDMPMRPEPRSSRSLWFVETTLLDDVSSAGQDRSRDCDVECAGRLEVRTQFKFARLTNREIAWSRAVENLIDQGCTAAE